MRILSIETSCDETALSLVEASGDGVDARFNILGNVLLSQIELHREYGGVYPNLAKREHARNLIPLFKELLEKSESSKEGLTTVPQEVDEILNREPELLEQFKTYIPTLEKPDIDAIAVTQGPGLEPALWVGINFAKALAAVWDIPIVPVNHMEGHVISSMVTREGEAEDLSFRMQHVSFPALALLISGGHTELVRMDDWHHYEKIGSTRDDAVGEAFDKVARMLGLPYPGGPEVSKLARGARDEKKEHSFSLPRPMIDSPDLDFSFSGLKTAVLYETKERGDLSDEDKKEISLEFENAATDVLLKKTIKALEETGAQTLAIGGGVSANTHIREVFITTLRSEHPEVLLCIPETLLTTDNALMIAMAGYFRAQKEELISPETLSAQGNLSLAS